MFCKSSSQTQCFCSLGSYSVSGGQGGLFKLDSWEGVLLTPPDVIPFTGSSDKHHFGEVEPVLDPPHIASQHIEHHDDVGAVTDVWMNAHTKAGQEVYARRGRRSVQSTQELDPFQTNDNVWERRGRSTRRKHQQGQDCHDYRNSTPQQHGDTVSGHTPSRPHTLHDHPPNYPPSFVSSSYEVFELEPPTTPSPKVPTFAGGGPKFQYTPPKLYAPTQRLKQTCQNCGREVWARALSVHAEACARRVAEKHGHLTAHRQRCHVVHARGSAAGSDSGLPNNLRNDVREPVERSTHHRDFRSHDLPPAYDTLHQAQYCWDQWVNHRDHHGITGAGTIETSQHSLVSAPDQHQNHRTDGSEPNRRYFTQPQLPY